MTEPQFLRPYGIVIEGRLEVGLEAICQDGRIVEVRPHTGLPEPYILSPAFVNAHSHLEYRGFQDRIPHLHYLPWIREITRLKPTQTPDEVLQDCRLAAAENRATGVWKILEHSDRPGAAQAMSESGLRGEIFQEVITLFEHAAPTEKLAAVEAKAKNARQHFPDAVQLNPHAYQTVDRKTLAGFAGKRISIHVAETDFENQFTREGDGPFAELYRSLEIPFEATGLSVVATLDHLLLASPNAQFVHCCAIDEGDIEILAKRQVSVAHCPRSNLALGCPPAPIREMLDAGIRVGLGLDSAASSGPIDFFQEMRAVLEVSLARGRALSAEEVWRMATGDVSLSDAPTIKIYAEGCHCTEDILNSSHTKAVEWLDKA